jgi:hypothetical protein
MTNPALPILAALLAVSLQSQVLAQEAITQRRSLDLESLAAWRDHILPNEDELSWETLPWLTSFSAGLKEAATQTKPVIVWVMNGHPLGCT